MATCVPSEVLSDGRCWQCLSPKALLVAQTVLISRVSGVTPPPPVGGGNMLFEDSTEMQFEDGVDMDFET